MWAEAKISIPFPPEILNVIKASLEPEIKGARFQRTRIDLETSNGKLTLRFKSRDTSSIRAALNSYIIWIRMTLEIYEGVLK